MYRQETLLTLLCSLLVLALLGCSGNGQAESKDKMEDEKQAKADDQSQQATKSVASGADRPIRDHDNPIVTLETDYGKMVLELYRDVAPTHVDSFVARTKEGFYDGTIFHRVIDGFMIQGGDPEGTGMGNAGYYIDAEFSDLPHVEGTLSMARAQSPNSASCQFFICLGAAPFLDGKYTVFGHLIKGYDVLHEIGKVETVAPKHNPREKSKPVEDVHVKHAYLSDAQGDPLDT